MGAPRTVSPTTLSGGTPVGGSGNVNTIPIWVGTSTLGDSAVTQVAGSIFSLTGLVGGTGYSAATSVALGGGTGTGATGSIITSGGVVTWVQLLNPGSGYTAGNVLTIPGGGGNATITVLAVVPKNDASGHLTAQRIGAGTTQPNAGIDSRLGALIDGARRYRVNTNVGSSTVGFGSYISTAQIGNNETSIDIGPLAGTTSSSAASILLFPRFANTLGGTIFATGIDCRLYPPDSVLGQTPQSVGYQAEVLRRNSNDLSQTANLFGVAASTGTLTQPSFISGSFTAFSGVVFLGTGGTTTTARTLRGTLFQSNSVTHTVTTVEMVSALVQLGTSATLNVTTFYGLRLEAPLIGSGSALNITNRYPIAQEDTLGTNYVRAKTHFGAAVGTAAATNASVEVTAQGTLNGDVRLNSASAVFDASNSSTNGVRFFARTAGTDLPATTTQSWYEEGTYTPAGNVNYTLGTCTATWTRIGRKVFVTLNFAAGVNNGSTIAGASSIGLPNGLAPARSGLGIRAQVTGAASGNGVVAVNAATGLIEISTTVALDANAKVIQCEYEV